MVLTFKLKFMYLTSYLDLYDINSSNNPWFLSRSHSLDLYYKALAKDHITLPSGGGGRHTMERGGS